ncbi:MAG: hypothetical protein ABL997_09750 [Planctomycetota bacterium]
MRDCPTVDGSSVPLIIHRIAVSSCLDRQGCNYHKCHRCVYRGKAAGWEPEGSTDELPRGVSPRTGERAVPTKTVQVPRPAKENTPLEMVPVRHRPDAVAASNGTTDKGSKVAKGEAATVAVRSRG